MAEFDLENFLKDSSVSDLDWLDVDETDYREMDTLPKQNLDIQPDLEALWARDGESPTAYLTPNVSLPNPGIEDPRTMGDMSQIHGRLRAKAEQIRKIARFALMQSNDPGRFCSEMLSRFDRETLEEHRVVLAEVLKERGLLGNLYINAEDFPTCAQGGKLADFVRKYAGKAQYLLAKEACTGCSCASSTPTGGTHCGVFHKEIQFEVPYSEELAEAIERSQEAQGCSCSSKAASDPKERIRQAFLAPQTHRESESYEGQGVDREAKVAVSPQEAYDQLTHSTESEQKKQAELDAEPVVAFLHREMVKGLSTEELTRSLKLAFDADLLSRTQAYWGPLFKETGLYGVVYTKQASFDDCHKGADFLAKHNPGVRAVVAGEKCGSCIYNKTRCLLYGKPLIKEASEVITKDTVEAVLEEHKMAGRLAPWNALSAYDDDPGKALRAIHAMTLQPSTEAAEPRMGFMEGFHGQEVGHVTSGLTRQDVAKQASKYMNEGLYGDDLLEALKTRFEVRDLVAAKSELRPVLAEQGLQGIFYVDPSVYDDYGKGCEESARLHRTRVVGYVKRGSKCLSCVHQTSPGFCSKINKSLVDEPPYVNKAAQQREVLASGRSTDVSYDSLVNNGASALTEFQMQNGMNVEVKEAADPNIIPVEFGTGEIDI